MNGTDYPETLARFERLVREKATDRTMVALIIDSPWLPGYAGVGMLDFYFDPQTWRDVYFKTLDDLPGVAFVPGTWVEFGMAAEPSGWGCPIQWSDTQPPGVHHYPAELSALAGVPAPDPETDGLMAVALRQYERLKPQLEERGLAPRMAAARGPLAVASHLVGVTELLMATQIDPDHTQKLLDKTTELCIRWLRAQLERMDDPIGILVLDDLVGMMGPGDAETFAFPRLKEVFDAFPDQIHVFHNDTPNPKVFGGLATVGIDVFNFSHETDLKTARDLLGPNVVLMGNLPPLDLLVRGTPDQVREATQAQLDQLPEVGPMLVSPGGGVSPGTPIENLQAMCEVVNESQT